MNQKRVTGTEIVQKQKREVAITFLGKNPKKFKEAAQYSGLSLSSVYRVWKNHKVGIKKNSPKRGRRPKYLELKLGKNIPISGIKEVEVKNKIKIYDDKVLQESYKAIWEKDTQKTNIISRRQIGRILKSMGFDKILPKELLNKSFELKQKFDSDYPLIQKRAKKVSGMILWGYQGSNKNWKYIVVTSNKGQFQFCPFKGKLTYKFLSKFLELLVEKTDKKLFFIGIDLIPKRINNNNCWDNINNGKICEYYWTSKPPKKESSPIKVFAPYGKMLSD
jgi:hypothetical protein